MTKIIWDEIRKWSDFKKEFAFRGVYFKEYDEQIEFRCPFAEHRIIPVKESTDAVTAKKKKRAYLPHDKLPTFFVGKSGHGICLSCWKQTSSFGELLNAIDLWTARGKRPDQTLYPCFICKTRTATTSVPEEGRYLNIPINPDSCEICSVCKAGIIMDFEAKKAILPYLEWIMADGLGKQVISLLDELNKIDEIKGMETRERLESILESHGRILKQQNPVFPGLHIYRWIKPSQTVAISYSLKG